LTDWGIGAHTLFKNYDDPFTSSTSWITVNAATPPGFNMDTGGEILVEKAIFYSPQINDTIYDRFPKNFAVYSSDNSTGPFELRGTTTYAGIYPPTEPTSVTVVFDTPTLARYWRLEVSGHENITSEISQIKFFSPIT
jgi:hypothetical protein